MLHARRLELLCNLCGCVAAVDQLALLGVNDIDDQCTSFGCGRSFFDRDLLMCIAEDFGAGINIEIVNCRRGCVVLDEYQISDDQLCVIAGLFETAL